MNMGNQRNTTVWVISITSLAFLVGMFALPVELNAAPNSVDLQLNPDTKALVDTGETITERIVWAVQNFAVYACVILFLIAAGLRATAKGNQNKIESANSFAFWGVIAMAVAFTVDRIVSFFMGIFAT